MKRAGIYLFLFLNGTLLLAQLRDPLAPMMPGDKQHALKINFLSPVIGSVSVFYQHLLTKKSSLQLGFAYMENDMSATRRGIKKTEIYRGMALTLDYRIQIEGEGLNGLYLQPFTRFIRAENYFSDHEEFAGIRLYSFYTDHVRSLGLGCVIGYQKTYRNKFCMEIFAGPVQSFVLQFYGNDPSQTYKVKTLQAPMVNGFGIRGGATVGWLF